MSDVERSAQAQLRSSEVWASVRSSAHVAPTTLRAYADLDLADDEMDVVDTHLEACGVCRAALRIIDSELSHGTVDDDGTPSGGESAEVIRLFGHGVSDSRKRGDRPGLSTLVWTAGLVAAAAAVLLVSLWPPAFDLGRALEDAELHGAEEGALLLSALHPSGLSFVGPVEPPAPLDAGFARGFADAMALLVTPSDQERGRAWQDVRRRHLDAGGPGVDHGRWLALLAYGGEQPASALERAGPFVDWAERLLSGPGSAACRRALDAVRAVETPDESRAGAARRLSRCLLLPETPGGP